MKQEFDAAPPDAYQEDIDDDGKSIYEKESNKPIDPYFFEAYCNIRLYLRRYCIILLMLICFPATYSIIYCGPLDLKMYDLSLSNPAFNKFETKSQCPTISDSIKNGVIAMLIYYGLKVYNKFFLSLLYLCLLLYFGWEVRRAKLEWSTGPSAVTSRVSTLYYFEMAFNIFQTVSLFPFLVGGFILIRHVRRKKTEAEIARHNKKYEEEASLLKTKMKEMKELEDEARYESEVMKKTEVDQQQLVIAEEMELKNRLARIRRLEKDIKTREEIRNKERAKKQKENAEKRMKRRQSSFLEAEFDERLPD